MEGFSINFTFCVDEQEYPFAVVINTESCPVVLLLQVTVIEPFPLSFHDEAPTTDQTHWTTGMPPVFVEAV